MGCDPSGANETTCVGKFIESFGKRAYRRPLAAPEIDRAKKLYAAGRMNADAANGIGLERTAVNKIPKTTCTLAVRNVPAPIRVAPSGDVQRSFINSCPLS